VRYRSSVASVRILRDGLNFGEGPRWHDGRLWYSDMYDHAVHAITIDGDDERIVEVPGQPSGLGWMPDGTMLVASMTDRKVMRWDGSSLTAHADLNEHATFHANDLVVDAVGRAYVGNFGFDLDGFIEEHGIEGLFGPGVTRAVVCRVDPDGAVSVAADDLLFPNGTVITPDGATMIVAESIGLRLTAFDVASGGELTNRRVWADLSSGPTVPDGICLDEDGAVWVANALAPACVRVSEGGDVLDRVEVSQNAYACMLGGADGRHLFVMTAASSSAAEASRTTGGRIEVTEVAVPHAGLP